MKRLNLEDIKYVLRFLNARTKRKEKRPFFPLRVNFSITYRCNSRCKTCGIWRYKPVSRELTTEEIKKIFQDKLLKRVLEVSITGGEPTTRRSLAEDILAITENIPKVRIGVVSNGVRSTFLINCIQKVIGKVYFYLQVISLDGIGKLHDRIRGVKGNFERVVKTITQLKKLDREYSNFDFLVSLTISPYNVKHLDKILEFCKKKKIKLSCVPVRTDERFFLTKLQKLKFSKLSHYYLRKVKKFIQHAGYEKYPSWKNWLRYTEGRKSISLSLPCFALYTSFWLDPYGKIFPCSSLANYLVGDLRKVNYKLSRIWYSDEIDIARRKIDNHEFKVCEYCFCEFAFNYLSSMDVRSWIKLGISRVFKDRSTT